VVLSLISDSQELGWVPRWVLANEETNTQSGDSVTEMFAGSAWQYLWLVPQDPADLASLLGGTSNEISMLNDFFDFSQIAADPSSAASAWQGGAVYDPTDEPDLEAPYTYDAIGAAWQTRAVTPRSHSRSRRLRARRITLCQVRRPP
jgi:putative alpha-1,2-mannosidase